VVHARPARRVTDAPDWNVPAPPGPRLYDWLIADSVVVIPAVVVVVAFVAGSPLLGFILLGAFLVGGVGGAALSGRRALARVAAVPIGPDESPRLHNLVAGLAARLHVAPPALWVIREGGPNAMVAGVLGRARLAVTASLLDRFARSELEAVVAHCLVRAERGRRWRASVAVWLGRPGRRLAPPVGSDDDVRAAALTRYPPALAAAIRKSEPRRDRLAPLWFVADGPPHRPAEEREAALLDL
jgi:hypothetical protein